MKGNMMPLVDAKIGDNVEITGVFLVPTLKRRLETMGFAIGGKLVPISRKCGSVVVAIGSSRVAVNEAIASKILVK